MTTNGKGKTKATRARGKTKATSLKEFLSNLATDARKLGEFLHEPEAAMSAANLSEEDKAALRSGIASMVAARIAGVPMDQAFKPMAPPIPPVFPVYPMKMWLELPFAHPMKAAAEPPMFVAYPQKAAAEPPMFVAYPQKVAAEAAPLIHYIKAAEAFYMKHPPPQLIVHPQYVVYPPQYVVYPPQFVVQPPPQYVVYPPQFVVQWPYYPQ